MKQNLPQRLMNHFFVIGWSDNSAFKINVPIMVFALSLPALEERT